MVVYDSNNEVGDYIGIKAREGETVSVECADGSFSGVVCETPDDVPVEEYQTKELLLVRKDESDGEYDDVFGLYAQVTEMTIMRAEYDVYAVFVPPSGESEGFGEIEQITVEE